MSEKIKFTDVGELTEFLNIYEIPHQPWGEGGTKTLQHLFKELEGKVSILKMYKNKPVRLVQSVVIDVCYILTDSSTLILQEKEHRFKNGQVKERETHHTVSEKIPLGGSETMAVRRCMASKLRFNKPSIFLERLPMECPLAAGRRHLKENKALVESCLFFRLNPYETCGDDEESFTGLPTRRKHFVFVCIIPKPLLTLPAFSRKHGGKTTRYEWELLQNANHYIHFLR